VLVLELRGHGQNGVTARQRDSTNRLHVRKESAALVYSKSNPPILNQATANPSFNTFIWSGVKESIAIKV
jgi:hypothetical protein